MVMTNKHNTILIDGMTCPYCSKDCKTQGTIEPSMTADGTHVACFCPCHALAMSVIENKSMTDEVRKLRKELAKLQATCPNIRSRKILVDDAPHEPNCFLVKNPDQKVGCTCRV